jgi:hypothetical protein
MKTLDVRYLDLPRINNDLRIISSGLDALGSGELIDTVNWDSFIYKPEVRFNIAYSSQELLLKYYVNEECVKAEMTGSDQPVWQDSCVEFFISPTDDDIYFNLEINPIGTCLLASGKNRYERIRSDNSIINKIRRESSLGSAPFKERTGNIRWTITLAIPLEVFDLNNPETIKGSSVKANFYKCGDKLSKPHYLTWNRIDTPKPDFHRPEFFGTLRFV